MDEREREWLSILGPALARLERLYTVRARQAPAWLGEALGRVKEPWVLRPTWKPAPTGPPPAPVRVQWVAPEWPDPRLPEWPDPMAEAGATMGQRAAEWRRELRMRMRVPYERQREASGGEEGHR